MKLTINHFASKTLLTATLLLASLHVWALQDDTNQPINIVSDNQSLDLEHNVVTFTDNVVITQGSIIIKAQKVVITRPQDSKQQETIDATGNPVTFHQMMDDGKPVDGKAQKVHYDLSKEFLTLTGNAELKQLDSKINGNVITYDVKKQQLNAVGSPNSRVRTVLLPAQLKNK